MRAAAPCHSGRLDSPVPVVRCMRIADLFSRLDNTNRPLSYRSMHGQPSLHQIFFTSELLDMEAFSGILRLPPGSADMLIQSTWSRPNQIPTDSRITTMQEFSSSVRSVRF